jgi:hypothetical protein
MLSLEFIALTLAPFPPSSNIAGGYLSSCLPETFGSPPIESARFADALSLMLRRIATFHPIFLVEARRQIMSQQQLCDALQLLECMLY